MCAALCVWLLGIATFGGAVSIWPSSSLLTLRFLQSPFTIRSVVITNSHALGHTIPPALNGQFAGALFLSGIQVAVSIEHLTVNETSSNGDAGALVRQTRSTLRRSVASIELSVTHTCGRFASVPQYITDCIEVHITDSVFSNSTADYAGAISVDGTPTLEMVNTVFQGVSANSRGGRARHEHTRLYMCV